jgi:hypothetical protein
MGGGDRTMMKNYQVQLKTDLRSSVYKTLYIKAYSVGQIVDQLGEDYYVTEVEEWKVDGSRTDRDAQGSSQGQAS